jgi:hypothetical protein
MQSIGESIQFVQENLSVVSVLISLFALVATCGNFWNSSRAFSASNYPKLRTRLYLFDGYNLPVCDVYNESDSITTNDIKIELSFISWREFKVFKGKWFTYTYEKLERLKPLEQYIPSDLSYDELSQWFRDRGLEPNPPVSVEAQQFYQHISRKKPYRVRLIVSYKSNVFGANKVCKISQKGKLIPCSRPMGIKQEERDFYWKLVC